MENTELVELLTQMANSGKLMAKQQVAILKINRAILEDYAEQMAALTLQSKDEIKTRVLDKAGIDDSERSFMQVVKD